jgi:hypothetical protein
MVTNASFQRAVKGMSLFWTAGNLLGASLIVITCFPIYNGKIENGQCFASRTVKRSLS